MRHQIAPKPHVYVISQSARVTGVLSERLTKAGYAVSAGETEREVMERITRRSVQALIYHVQGRANGPFDLLDRLKQRESDARVLLVGPDREPDQVAGFVRGGAYDYLKLPIGPGKLEESLRQALTTYQTSPKMRAPMTSLKVTNRELARERDNLRRWNHNLTVVHELSQAISGTLNADEIVSITARRLAQFLSYDLVGVAWWDPERVWVQTAKRIEPERVAATRSALLARSRVKAGREGNLALNPARRRASGSQVAGRTQAIELPLPVGEDEQGLIRLERDHGGPFSSEDQELLGTLAASIALALRNAEAHSQVQSMAMTDGLTGLLNRRAFADHLTRAIRAGDRYHAPTCLVMSDLDHFKHVNDQMGHPAGDLLLREVARLINNAVRSVDIVARYGGEEFAIILPHTDLEPARTLAERIRKMLERHEFVLRDQKVRITISMGLARIPSTGITKPEDWVAAADQALYRAKTAGRNRIAACEGPEEVGQQVSAPLYALHSR